MERIEFMNETRCPYCGKKIGYFTAFSLHNQGEYFCPKCKKESNIIIKKTLLMPFISAVVVAIFILLAFLMFTKRDNLWFMLFIAVPFFAFYAITPLFVRLKPKKNHMDVLYDTQMVDSKVTEPDSTMAKSSRVVPAFVDDVVLDDEFKPKIDSDIFDAIKNGRKNINEESSNTKSVESFENISSSKVQDKTMPVQNLKEISAKKAKEKQKVQIQKESVEKKQQAKIDAVIDEILNESEKEFSKENSTVTDVKEEIKEPVKVESVSAKNTIDEDIKIREEKSENTKTNKTIKYDKGEYDLSLFE